MTSLDRQLALNCFSRILISGYYNDQRNIEDLTQLIQLQANDKKTVVLLPKCLAEIHSSVLKEAINAQNVAPETNKPEEGKDKADEKKIIVQIGKPSLTCFDYFRHFTK